MIKPKSPINQFLSTPSARRATDAAQLRGGLAFISIHALREEGDYIAVSVPEWRIVFLSTPSARRATLPLAPLATPISYFYPRPPRGGRLEFGFAVIVNVEFLSTPSARRATYPGQGFGGYRPYFYPRPPRGGRRVRYLRGHDRVPISIHALREEGDEASSAGASGQLYFYPRPPRGGRPSGLHTFCTGTDFYPRPPRGGRHGMAQGVRPDHADFYPRPPRGGRLRM